MPNPAVGMRDYEEGAHLQTISPLQPLSQDLPGQPLPAVLIPSLKLEHVNLSKWYSDFNQRRRMRVSHLGAADQVPTAS